MIKLFHIFSFATLITGTALGGGILGLPVLAGMAGFVPSAVCLVFMWIFMTLSGGLIIYAFYESNSFDFASLYREKLGSYVKNFHAVVFLITLYGLLVAYLSGIGSSIVYILPQVKVIPYYRQIIIVVFFLFATALVVFSSGFMRKSNAFLNVFMFIIFAVLAVITSKHIRYDNLAHSAWRQYPLVMPILVTAFGYQAVLPVVYKLTVGMHNSKSLTYTSLVLGTFIILVINLLWILVVLGVIPVFSESGISITSALKSGVPVTIPLSKIVNSDVLLVIAMVFTFFAIVTSYIGIGASLLNYIEGLTKQYIHLPKFWYVILTFLLPLIFVFTYPNIFIKALSFVGGFGIIIVSGFIPAFLGLRTAKSITVKAISIFVLAVSSVIFICEIFVFFKF